MKAFRAILLALAVCNFGAVVRAEWANGILAIVNDSVITSLEVEMSMAAVQDELRRQYRTQPEVYNKKLAEAGWKSSMTDPCMQKTVEFWWDAINTHKIVPRGMPAYDRNEANAVFMSGDAAFTVADSLWWGTFNDPAKSIIAGKVAATRFPLGPNRAKPFAWDDIWGWAIPKSITPERKKLAKEMLEAMMLDKEGQKKLFKATGAPPPNTEFWAEIAAEDSFMQLLKESVLDSPDKVRGAYYFPQWPAVHKAFNDTVTRAVTGKREDIAKVLAEGAPLVSKAAQ